MKRLVFFSLLFIQSLIGAETDLDQYLKFQSVPNFGRFGDHTNSEMEIIHDKQQILEIQQEYYQQFINKGFQPEEAKQFSKIGIVEQDRYWVWLRDPIVLPNGHLTGYNRLFPKTSINGTCGVSVMGVTKNKEILVIVIFRHATREWELELPRGGRDPKETSQEAALRELEEETGYQGAHCKQLGSIAAESGFLSAITDLFFVSELSLTKASRDECESIDKCLFLSKDALKQAFTKGYILIELNGQKQKVFCRDAYLASALLFAETQGLL